MAKKKAARATDRPESRARRRPTVRAARQRAAAPRKERRKPASSAQNLTVVGIGTSAGGLEALSRFLQHVPGKTGLAYVVVQHLAPRHVSVLPGLLSASTPLPVVQVRDGMPLKPDRVHVIPPNVEMTLSKGRLHLTPRPHDKSQYTPIDAFFRSLAAAAEGRAVGVVLSGSASDGSMGLRDIKAAGGITIAQDPASARYDGMPRAAIATGIVDLVLTPEQSAHEIQRLSDLPYLRVAPEPPSSGEKDVPEPELERLFTMLRAASGVDFSQYKLPTIRRRLQRRMALHKTRGLGEYLALVDADPAELNKLHREMLIHVTRFFREPESFDALKKMVFPRIVADAHKRAIRIWVPGCATGEEAYSVAIALVEHLGADASRVPVQVFATDLSEEAIERARAGLYAERIADDVPPDRLRRFFAKANGQYRISKTIRDCCIFARQDLTRDPPFSQLDLIVCRNVLIYLGPRLQRKLMNVFHYALRPAGFLVVGATESVGAHHELFSTVDRRHKIFTRSSAPATTDFELQTGGGHERHGTRVASADTPSAPNQVQNEASRALIARYCPPAVVVDQDFQIIETRGKTSPYLELASGEPSFNTLKMAREGLLHGLRSALQECRKRLKPARREGLLVRVDRHLREVDLHVVPLNQGGRAPSFLVLFETPKRAAVAPRRLSARPSRRTRERDTRVERMQQELTTSREYLQAIIHDLEAANEELQSANEEVLSSNEELQSTNEELDTAKEELQSTNEELNTVNEELNARNEELSLVNADLVNLLTAVPAAVVIVSSQLRIRRFTPMAEQILNLIPTDVGRSLGDIKPIFDTPDLEEACREVIETVEAKDLLARDPRGRSFQLRIRTYKNQDNRIDGAVIALTEAGAQHPAAARELAAALVSAIAAPVAIVDDALSIQAVNEPFAALAGSTVAAMLDQPLFADGRQAWTAPDVQNALQTLRAQGEPFTAVPLAPGRPPNLVLSGRRLDAVGRSPWLVLTVRAGEPAPPRSARG